MGLALAQLSGKRVALFHLIGIVDQFETVGWLRDWSSVKSEHAEHEERSVAPLLQRQSS